MSQSNDPKSTFIINNEFNVELIDRYAEEMLHHNMKVMNNIDSYSFIILSASENDNVPKKLKKALGWCDYLTKTIFLNRDYFETCNLDAIVDTIFHECAHAIAFEIYGETKHGKYWKQVCREIGCDDKAKADLSTENFSEEHVQKEQEERINNAKWAVIRIFRDDQGKTVDYTIVTHCNRRLKKLHRRTQGNDMNSLGNLYHIPNEYRNSDINTVRKVMFQ